MESLQLFLIILLIIELMVIAACFMIITYFFSKSMKTFTNFIGSLERAKAFLTIPALILAIVGKILKKKGVK